MQKKTAGIDASMFLRGYCAEFAIALNEKYNHPIYVFEEIFEDGYTGFIHYAVKHPSGKYLDAKGLRTEEEILKNLLLSDTTPATGDKVMLRKTSVEEIEATTEIVEEALELAREYIKNKFNRKADFQQDKYYQQLAESAYEKIVKLLKSEGLQEEAAFEAYLDLGEDKPFEHKHSQLIKNDFYEGFQIEAAELGITENQYPLIFIFGTKNKIQNPALGFSKNRAVILFNNLQHPFHLPNAHTRLGKQTFIHEYIHYLDSGRGTKKNNYILQGHPEEQHLEMYYNNPKEMNAYYQESIPTLYSIVDSMVRNNYEPLQEALSSGYEGFFKLAIKFFNDKWWEYLTPENRRKIQKRLYHVFKDMENKLKK
jgi:hypothetical protein